MCRHSEKQLQCKILQQRMLPMEDTPTWAVATVCVVFVIISHSIEQGIHSIGMWFQGRQKKAMVEALEKIKADSSRFRLTHQISFVQRHSGLSTSLGLRWIVGFFRQFFASVTKAHFAPNSKFDFHKYIKRSMEDDFKAVVGISMPLWASAIIFQLLNVYRWYTLSWVSCAPLAVIIMEMAKEIRDRTSAVKGAPVVEPSDKFFWFNRPHFIFFLIHFTLFQNAFQMAYFLWIWYEFGLSSCFHENLPATVARVLFGVALQIVCSYITFPLYALVTQMGSHMKKAIFEEQTARERKKLRRAGPDVSIQLMGGHSTPSRGSSPIHLLHKHKPRASDIGSVLHSPKVT